SAADPEGDVVGAVRGAVRHEIACTEGSLGERLTRLFLLVGVSRDEAAAGAERHVDEARAVDARRGHAAPLVRRAEERAREVHGLAGDRPQPPVVALAAQVFAPRPAGVRVGRLDASPGAALLEDP